MLIQTGPAHGFLHVSEVAPQRAEIYLDRLDVAVPHGNRSENPKRGGSCVRTRLAPRARVRVRNEDARPSEGGACGTAFPLRSEI
jgi:hypothetical protein